MNDQTKARPRVLAPSRHHFLRAAPVADSLDLAAIPAEMPAGDRLTDAVAQFGGDLDILNYALTLEHLENAMYRVLIRSGLLRGHALQYAQMFGAHENTHVTALTNTIQQLGGTPVRAQRAYNFPRLRTQAAVIDLIRTVEDVGASAYLGAAPLIQNPNLLTVAVQIHTNEAEHAAGWRFLSGRNPMPAAFAPPRTRAQILEIVTPFL